MASANIPPWDTLPMEALEIVFGHLGRTQLAAMRLMCRHWNATICHSPALMVKFVLRFTSSSTVFQNRRGQLEIAKAITGRFREAVVTTANVEFMAGSPLWAKLGETIRTLHVTGRRDVVSVKKLSEVLRVLPNLRYLELDISKSELNFDEIPVDYKMEQLEQLKLAVDDDRFFDLFSKMCFKLKDFEYKHNGRHLEERFTVDDIMPLIYAQQDTLERISLKPRFVNYANLLRKISSASRLQLKSLSLEVSETIETDDIIEFCKLSPALDSLKLNVNDLNSQVLVNLPEHLQQLRKFSINIKGDDECEHLGMFLNRMPQLEDLSVGFEEGALEECFKLRGITCPQLKALTVSSFLFNGPGLPEFLRACPNIRRLGLVSFFVSDIEHVLRTLSSMKSLDFLEFSPEISVISWDEGIDQFHEMDSHGIMLNSVRTLHCNVPSIVACCPKVKTVDFDYDYEFSKHDIPHMLNRATELKDLKIDLIGVSDTDAVLRVIAKHGKRLDKLHLRVWADEGYKRSKRARKYLMDKLANIVDVQFTEVRSTFPEQEGKGANTTL